MSTVGLSVHLTNNTHRVCHSLQAYNIWTALPWTKLPGNWPIFYNARRAFPAGPQFRRTLSENCTFTTCQQRSPHTRGMMRHQAAPRLQNQEELLVGLVEDAAGGRRLHPPQEETVGNTADHPPFEAVIWKRWLEAYSICLAAKWPRWRQSLRWGHFPFRVFIWMGGSRCWKARMLYQFTWTVQILSWESLYLEWWERGSWRNWCTVFCGFHLMGNCQRLKGFQDKTKSTRHSCVQLVEISGHAKHRYLWYTLSFNLAALQIVEQQQLLTTIPLSSVWTTSKMNPFGQWEMIQLWEWVEAYFERFTINPMCLCHHLVRPQ